jgi:hypothetical protein
VSDCFPVLNQLLLKQLLLELLLFYVCLNFPHDVFLLLSLFDLEISSHLQVFETHSYQIRPRESINKIILGEQRNKKNKKENKKERKRNSESRATVFQ